LAIIPRCNGSEVPRQNAFNIRAPSRDHTSVEARKELKSRPRFNVPFSRIFAQEQQCDDHPLSTPHVLGVIGSVNMPGHRRKVSNSTVATVDNSRTKWLPETAILKPLKNIEANENSDQWPCFVLTDATVYLKDGKRMANPLLPDGPFVVRGQVHVDDKEKDQREARMLPGSPF
jgi:hypothetical protein